MQLVVVAIDLDLNASSRCFDQRIGKIVVGEGVHRDGNRRARLADESGIHLLKISESPERSTLVARWRRPRRVPRWKPRLCAGTRVLG